jgi:DNA-binding NtrC family response regulator
MRVAGLLGTSRRTLISRLNAYQIERENKFR